MCLPAFPWTPESQHPWVSSVPSWRLQPSPGAGDLTPQHHSDTLDPVSIVWGAWSGWGGCPAGSVEHTDPLTCSSPHPRMELVNSYQRVLVLTVLTGDFGGVGGCGGGRVLVCGLPDLSLPALGLKASLPHWVPDLRLLTAFPALRSARVCAVWEVVGQI